MLQKILDSKGCVKYCPTDYNTIDTNNILDIHRHLMKEI